MRPVRWRPPPWIAALAGGLLLLAVVSATFRPVRTALVAASSRAVLFLASPFAPDVGTFDVLPQSSEVFAADGTSVGQVGDEDREIVPLEGMPAHVEHAVLAAEDADFHHHAGIDPFAMARAAFKSATGDGLQGGSTISQQLAKINYAGRDRTILRKLREFLYTAELEQRFSKEHLLQRYVNQVYLGRGTYGFGAASEAFLGKPASELTVAEAALLAGRIRAPEDLDPWDEPEETKARRDQVLDAMRRAGSITDEEHAAATSEDLGVVADPPRTTLSGRAPHFVSYVRREAESLEALGGSVEARRNLLNVNGGLRIETTLDLDAYRAAVDAAREHLGEPDDPTTAIASVVPGDGAIRVLFGGLDPEQSFDASSQGRRQAGSAFKPYAYLGMVREGYDPRSRVDGDSPTTVRCEGEDWEVRNYGDRDHGRIDVRRGLVSSVNAVFARVTAAIGPDVVAETAVAAGIPADAVEPPVCALSLGGLRDGVSALDMAGSYATFAAAGMRAEPYAITRILDRDGEVLYEREPSTERAFERDVVGVLNGAMQQVVRSGTARGAAIGRPLAAKTGTTNDNVDAWLVGFVPQLSTAVWVGDPEGSTPMDGVTGGSAPARIFASYMREALAGTPVKRIPTTDPASLDLSPLPGGDLPTPTPRPTPTPGPTPSPTPDATPSPTPTATPEEDVPEPTPRRTPRTRTPVPSATLAPTPSPSPPTGD